MDERGINIDIVFRNGLKDMEVLPPGDVWDNIKPLIREKQRPVIIFRAAAFIAVMLSISLLAYRWSREFANDRPYLQIQAQSEESVMPSIPAQLQLMQEQPHSSLPLLSDANTRNDMPEQIINPVKFTESIQTSSFLENEKEASASLITRPGSAPEKQSVTPQGLGLPPLTLADLNTEAGKTGKWSLTALVSPQYYNRFTSGSEGIAAETMTSEQPLVSYSGGVSLSYKVNKRISIQSGLYYSSIEQNLSGITAYSGFNRIENTKGSSNFGLITADGTVFTSNSDIFLMDSYRGNKVITTYTSDVIDPVKSELQYVDNSLRQNFSYVELPVMVRYKVIDRTLDINIIGGVSSNLLVNNSVSAGTYGRKLPVGGTDGLNSIIFSSSLGMGLEYSFSKKLSMNLEPTVRYYLNPFSSASGINVHPYSVGVFSGISYRF